MLNHALEKSFTITSSNKSKVISLFILFFSFMVNNISAQDASLDILDYQLKIQPNIHTKSIEGEVLIHFRVAENTASITLFTGDLKVDAVVGTNVKSFDQKNNKVIVLRSKDEQAEEKITIYYRGNPTRGLLFNSDLNHAYTVFFTEHWMPCNNKPDDKATVSLSILVPRELHCIASGELIGIEMKGEEKLYKWQQNYETPAYTFGFTIGSFHYLERKSENARLTYYSEDYTLEEMDTIFQYTADMLYFFEEKAGVRLPQEVYSQVLIGNHYQEMSGYAILRASYGDLVLKDSTETNLISHELAHQWWGNRISCKNWNHFWLNEGFATFLSAAYNEHRFGREKYQQNMDAYFKVYDRIRAKGGDKPLVFKSWLKPSADDRNLVYFKGAYVIHLLREELGEEAFWQGIRSYSKRYFGKSVTTKDFQLAMESSSQRSLEDFFNKWIY